MVQNLTDFADQAVILPAAAVVAIGLALCGWRRGALAWTAGVGGTLAVILVLKLVVHACGPVDTLASPSGHTASAAVTAGGLSALCFRRHALSAALAAALAAGALIGATRLWLGVHTPEDVVVGAIAGLLGAACVQRLAGPRPVSLRPTAIRPGLVLAALLLVVGVAHGHRLGAEAYLRDAAEAEGCWIR